MFNIYLGIFIVVAIFTIFGGSFKMVKNNQTMAGILFGVGSLLIFAVYGLKWFSSGSTFSNAPVSWPPIINTCPDYLVNYPRQMQDGTIQNACIDLIGVSKNGSLKVFPKDGPAPIADDYYFSLITTSSDNNVKNNELCQRAITAGLTWEGITNGESCVSSVGPVAPGGGNGGSGCPAA